MKNERNRVLNTPELLEKSHSSYLDRVQRGKAHF